MTWKEWAIFFAIIAAIAGSIIAVICWPTSRPAHRTVCVREAPECGKPPELPSDARAKTADGAKAFITHHYATLNYVQRTGDYSPLLGLYASTCRRCGAIVDNAAELFDDQRYIEGGQYTITHFGTISLVDETAEVEVTLSRTAASLHGPDQQELLDSETAEPAARTITLAWTHQSWRMASLEATYPYYSEEIA